MIDEKIQIDTTRMSFNDLEKLANKMYAMLREPLSSSLSNKSFATDLLMLYDVIIDDYPQIATNLRKKAYQIQSLIGEVENG